MSDQRFRFGPLERRGLLIGLSLRQLVTLTGAAGVAVVVTAGAPTVVGVALAATAVVAGCAAAFVPIGGQTAVAWAPIALSMFAALLTGRPVHRSMAHVGGHRLADGRAAAEVEAPPPLRGCMVAGCSGAEAGELGVIDDRTSGTVTAVLVVRGTGFTLLDDHERDRRLSWWGSFLEALCRDGSQVHRLQWCERAVAVVSLSMPDGVGGLEPMQRSHAELLRSATAITQRHECLLAVTVSTGRTATLGRARRRERDATARAALERELRPLIERLRNGDIELVRVLDPQGLVSALRRAIEPEPTSTDATGGDVVMTRDPWPLATLTSWASYRTDATHHATYWVSEWPRTDVGPDFLAPLLLQTTARRTVALTMGFDPPGRAQREAEAALTADTADDELRRRAGFLVGFRRRREQENVLRRGEEIAAGHGSVRFSGYVTVTALTEDELAASCIEVEQQAQQSRLALRRLYGQQDVAFTYTLPLGRGLR